MKIEYKKIIIISLTLNEYDNLIKQIENDKHSFLICFRHIRRVGRAYKKELASVKAKTDLGMPTIMQMLQVMQADEYFTIEHGLRGYEAFYSTLDGKFTNERALIKLT